MPCNFPHEWSPSNIRIEFALETSIRLSHCGDVAALFRTELAPDALRNQYLITNITEGEMIIADTVLACLFFVLFRLQQGLLDALIFNLSRSSK